MTKESYMQVYEEMRLVFADKAEALCSAEHIEKVKNTLGPWDRHIIANTREMVPTSRSNTYFHRLDIADLVVKKIVIDL